MRLSRLCAVLTVTVAAPLIQAQSAPPAEDCCSPATTNWPRVAGNLGSHAYSALTQINKQNIKELAPRSTSRTSRSWRRRG
jgi:glucose dehydrogenase